MGLKKREGGSGKRKEGDIHSKTPHRNFRTSRYMICSPGDRKPIKEEESWSHCTILGRGRKGREITKGEIPRIATSWS